MRNFLERIWNKTKQKKRLPFLEQSLFFMLCFLEIFYKLFFSFFIWLKKKRGLHKVNSFKVISIGNLSVGGTGKSVFVSYLAEKLNQSSCAIVMRGYKGSNEKTTISLLVSDGQQIFTTPDVCGDEAYMLAQQISVPIVVGANRYKSCQLLEEWIVKHKKSINYILLDDAYQNMSLQKDYEFLLIDARWPLDNNHCLPAGRLREKDYSRADSIILTHADGVDDIESLKERYFSRYDHRKIFPAKHVYKGLFQANQGDDVTASMHGNSVLATAGIGSIAGFEKTLRQARLNVKKVIQFPDHYNYTLSDIESLIKYSKQNSLLGIVTTAKDWVKLEPLLTNIIQSKKHFFVVRIGFDFLDERSEILFFKQ